ncbi:MAG: DUF4143 domain-containing protein [Ferruginibacter sp.]
MAVTRYIDYLQRACRVHWLQPFHLNTCKRMVKAPKIFIRDSGLLQIISRKTNMRTLKGHPLAGNSCDGYVVEEVLQALPKGLQTHLIGADEVSSC